MDFLHRQGTLPILFQYLTMALTLMSASCTALADVTFAQNAQTQLQQRIVGGIPTPIAQVPSTVALLRRARVLQDGDLFQAQFCGGTVIAERWILTAAHCVVDLEGNIANPNSLLVLTGSANLVDPTNQPIAVVRVITHPEYRSVEQGRDIALLQLEYDALVPPIAIDGQAVNANDTAFIAGWGAVNSREANNTQNFPEQLRGAFVNMTPGASCGTLFPTYSGLTNDTNVCAGVVEGGKDSCQGDSGGPLYRVNTTANQISAVTGITSWGVSCGLAENPGVYTHVASYVNWIRSELAPFNVQVTSQLRNDNAGLANNGNSGALPQPTAQPVPSNDDISPIANVEKDDDSIFLGSTTYSTFVLLILLLARRQVGRIRRSIR